MLMCSNSLLHFINSCNAVQYTGMIHVEASHVPLKVLEKKAMFIFKNWIDL